MHVREEDRERLEELDEGRRRVNDEYNLLVQQIREGSVRDTDRVRLQARHLQIRHEGLIQNMIDLLNY